MEVFIVEHCEFFKNKLDVFIDCTVVHVASTHENAVEWCKKNTDYDDAESIWWFVIVREIVDVDLLTYDKMLHAVDKYGQVVTEALMPKYALDAVYDDIID